MSSRKNAVQLANGITLRISVGEVSRDAPLKIWINTRVDIWASSMTGLPVTAKQETKRT